MIRAALLLSAACLAMPAVCQAQTFAEGTSQWNLTMVGAEAAYRRGYTGAGVTAGVIDSGLDMNHPEFRGRVSGTRYDGILDQPDVIDAHGHGTHVAGIIGAARDGVGVHGVAYDVVLAPLRLLDENNAASDNAVVEGGLIEFGLDAGVRLFNASYGPELYGLTSYTPAWVEGVLQEWTMTAFRRVAASDAIIVWATGNETQSNANLQASAPLYFPELQPHWLAVTAVGNTGNIASYANRCGTSAQWCLAAPGGDRVIAPSDTVLNSLIASTSPGTYDLQAGTSQAAPMVTGAVAIAMQMYPRAKAGQLTRLVLATATDIGAPAVDSEYGWGLLNIANLAATRDAQAASVFANTLWATDRGTALTARTLSDRLNIVTARGAWVAVDGGRFDHDVTATAPPARAESFGVTVGGDLVAGDDRALGVALTLRETDLDETGAGVGNFGEASSVGLAVYGGLRQGRIFAEGSAGLERREIDYRRGAVVGAAGTVLAGQGIEGRAETDGYGVFMDARMGLALPLGRLTVRPFVHGQVVKQQVEGFRETGADIFSLSVGEARTTRFEAGPGVEAVFTAGPGGALNAVVGARYAFTGGDDDFRTPARMLGSPVPGAVGASGDAVTVWGGIETRLGRRWSAGARGFWTSGEDQGGAGLAVSLQARF
jgi:outer membrane autotransporter protein